jgi:hypothetical protein
MKFFDKKLGIMTTLVDACRVKKSKMGFGCFSLGSNKTNCIGKTLVK